MRALLVVDMSNQSVNDMWYNTGVVSKYMAHQTTDILLGELGWMNHQGAVRKEWYSEEKLESDIPYEVTVSVPSDFLVEYLKGPLAERYLYVTIRPKDVATETKYLLNWNSVIETSGILITHPEGTQPPPIGILAAVLQELEFLVREE